MSRLFAHFAREVLAEVELKRDQLFQYQDHTEECRDEVDGYLRCTCATDVETLMDDLVDAVRHQMWLSELEGSRVAS